MSTAAFSFPDLPPRPESAADRAPAGDDVGSTWVRNPNRTLPAIEAEFDTSAPLYEARSAAWDYRGARDGAVVFARHVAPGARVLDAGCGSGLVGDELAARGFADLTGCDISEGMLARAAAKGHYRGGLHRAAITEMPLADGAFDAVVCIAVLTYVPDIEAVMREFHRVTRIGARIVFSHRVDLETACGFDTCMDRLTGAGTWRVVEVTPPQLYYPQKADYGDRVTVRYHCLEKRQAAFDG